MNEKIIYTSPLKAMIPIIKIVDGCNLKCEYCFYYGQQSSSLKIMDIALLEKSITEYMNLFSGNLTFIWHGGEPLLAGMDYFQKIVAVQKKNFRQGQKVQNIVQTNATLINNEWAQFFSVNQFGVGVSLDGNQKSHDYFRKTPNNKGSFESVIRSIEILRRYNIEPGIIQTLTHDNLNNIEEDFYFFVNELRIKDWGLNTFIADEYNHKSIIDQTVTVNDYTNFLEKLIDLWLEQNNPALKIREIENFIAGALKKQTINCAFNNTCSSFFCINYDGKVYPCDRFSDKEDLLFGNLSISSLVQILNGEPRMEYARLANTEDPECVSCEWRKSCRNGCTFHRINGKYFYCESRKTIFALFKKKLENLK